MRTSLDTIDDKISREDFGECGWKQIVEATDPNHYTVLGNNFFIAAQEATNNKNVKQARILQLLSKACSMLLNPKKRYAPFEASIKIAGKRTALPDDFSEEEILFFSSIVDDIDHFWLKARLADLVWLCNKKLGIRFALIAIDAYRSVPVDKMYVHTKQCFERALALSKMLGKSGEDQLAQTEKHLSSIVNEQHYDKRDIVYCCAEVLYESSLGINRAQNIAKKMLEFAQQCDKEQSCLEAQTYFEASERWFSRANDKQSAYQSVILRAESLEKESAQCLNAKQSGHAAAVTIIEEAIQAYRSIPQSSRPAFDVEKRIENLRTRLSYYNAQSLQEMMVLRSPAINISQYVKNAEQKVAGKTLQEALLAFANMSPFQNVEALRHAATESIKKNPIAAMISKKMLSPDGRIIAKHQEARHTDGEIPCEDLIVEAMLQQYCSAVGLKVQAQILPASTILYLEHKIREEEIFKIVSYSPIIPENRANLFSKALYAGFNNDFITCIHLLVPQIEHMVRFHLKARGVLTTTLDANSLEMENGLSTLMSLPKTKEIFGKDLAFEIRALFSTPSGPNIRNDLAHGLLEEDFFTNAYSIYAWWLSFKFVYNIYWNRNSNNRTL